MNGIAQQIVCKGFENSLKWPPLPNKVVVGYVAVNVTSTAVSNIFMPSPKM